MNKLRKFLVVGVMVLSVIAMSGLPMTSVKAAASAGDLIKMDGLSSVYYLGNDGKRYVFPNESTYFSWYADFSGVVTIPASELQSYPLGGNVTMRPGTKMVKITTDPSVYAVEPNGVLRKIQNESQAAALYGTNWNKRIVDLADAFFTNYTIGSPLADGQIPAGSLVKNASSATVYYFDGTNYRAVASEAALAANRLWLSNVLTVTNTLTAGGTALSAMETSLVNTAQNGGTGVVITGSGLMVSLNSMTPASMSIPQGGTRIPFAKFNLTASNDGAINLNSITLKRTGLSDYEDFSSNGIWMEKNGVRVTSQKTMNSNDEVILTFSPVLTVNAGQTVTLEAVASLSASASGNIALGIASASAVSATAASVTGSFPVTGNLMSITTYDVADITVTGRNGSSALAPKVGDTKAELGQFTVAFGTDKKDVVFKSIMLKNTGVEDLSGATANLYLEKGGNVVSANGVVDGRFVTFTLNDGGLLIEKGDSAVFKIKGDIMAKDNTGTSTTFSIAKKDDVSIVEKSTGFGAAITLYQGSTEIVDSATFAAGAVSITKKSTTPNNYEVIKGSDNNVSLIANVRADEAITADGIKIDYVSTATTTAFEDAKVYVNGVLLGSFDPALSSVTSGTETIDSAVSFKKGDNEVKVVVNVKTDATAGNITFKIVGSNFLNGQSPEYANGNAVSSSDINGSPEGAKLTVKTANLALTRNDGYADPRVVVKGNTDVSLAKFSVKAEYDTVKITSIELGSNSASGTKIPDSSVYDMKIFVDGVQIGNTRDFSSSGAVFSSLNYAIAKDAIKTIEIKGSFDTAATGTLKTTMTVNSEDSLGKANTVKTADTTTIQVTGAGTVNVAVGADTPSSRIILANSGVATEVAQFKLTAVDSSADITKLTISTATTTDARVASYELYKGATKISTGNPYDGVTEFTISNSALLVAANTNETISVKVLLNGIDTYNQSNVDLQVKLTGYEFVSAGVTEEVGSLNYKAHQMNIRKTAPVFALQTATRGQGPEEEVYKFSVTNSGAEDLFITSLVLTEVGSASGTAAVADFKLYEGSTEKATSSNATFTFATGTLAVAKGTSKTFVVKADTSVVPADATFGLSLSKSSANNVVWYEDFIGGDVAGNATYMNELPLAGTTPKY